MDNIIHCHEIIVITPTSSQPRYHKRVTQLEKFCEVSVFAFNRGYYNENTFPRHVNVFHLGNIEDGRYLRRTLRIASAILKIRSHLKNKRTCLFYAMSFDCMIIARFCGVKYGFYYMTQCRI